MKLETMESKIEAKKGKAKRHKTGGQMAVSGAMALEETEHLHNRNPLEAAPLIQWRRLDQIKPHPLNEQIYGDLCPDNLIKSVKERGIHVPLIVTRENILISGKWRLTAARLAGLEEVPIIEKMTTDDDHHRLLLIECNNGRRKTTEHLIREYREIKRIEELRAPKRKGQRTDLRANSAGSPCGRARDLAAARVGHLSATTFEMGVTVVEILDRKTEPVNDKFVKKVRETLNGKSVKGARDLLIEIGWLERPGADNPGNPTENEPALPLSDDEPATSEPQVNNTDSDRDADALSQCKAVLVSRIGNTIIRGIEALSFAQLQVFESACQEFKTRWLSEHPIEAPNEKSKQKEAA